MFLSESLYLRDDLAGSMQLIDTSYQIIETTDGWLDAYATAYEVMIPLAYARGSLDTVQKIILRGATAA